MNSFKKKYIIKNAISVIMIFAFILWLLNLYLKFYRPLYSFAIIPIIVVSVTYYLYEKDVLYRIFELGQIREFYDFAKKRYGIKNKKYKKLIFMIACFLGDEKVIYSFDEPDADSDLSYLEYLLISQRFDEAKQILERLQKKANNNTNVNYLWTEKVAEAVIENDFTQIVNEEIDESGSIIQKCRMKYWKGYALYMLERKDEAYKLFKQVIDCGTDTIYEKEAKKYIEYSGETKYKSQKKYFKYISNKKKCAIAISVMACILIMANIAVPMKNGDTQKIYSKYFYTSSKNIEVVKEEETDAYKQSIVLNYRLNEIDYCLFQKEEDKYILKKVKRMPFFGKDNGSVAFSDVILLTPYYDNVAFESMNKYIVFGEINSEEVFSDFKNRKYKLIEEYQCGKNKEFYCYRMVEQ